MTFNGVVGHFMMTFNGVVGHFSQLYDDFSHRYDDVANALCVSQFFL
jgi:hypothetical protein